VPRPVAVRGVIEGFYGPPWSHDARLALVDFLAARQMNAYVYAPKSDPKHRDAWRDPYEAVDADRFRELAAHCRQAGVRFGFAISPGLDIDYANATDRDALAGKQAVSSPSVGSWSPAGPSRPVQLKVAASTLLHRSKWPISSANATL